MTTKRVWKYQFDYHLVTFYQVDDEKDNILRFEVEEINQALEYIENGLNVILSFVGAEVFKKYHYYEPVGKKTKHFILETAFERLKNFDPENTKIQNFINWLNEIKSNNTMIRR